MKSYRILIVAALTGCAGGAPTLQLDASHPAHPAAAVAPIDGPLLSPIRVVGAPMQAPAATTHQHAPVAPTATPAGDAAIYTCPMHPAVESNEPGACPICRMALVRKPPSEEGAGDASSHFAQSDD
jgi:hypothetical protein